MRRTGILALLIVVGLGLIAAAEPQLICSGGNCPWSGTIPVALGSDARGDVYFRNSSGNLARLALGAAGTVLKGSATDPAYAAVSLTADVSGVLPRANGGTAHSGGITTAADGPTVTFDLVSTNSLLQALTLGGNRTLVVSNDVAGDIFTLRLIQDGTGSRTVTWFSGIKWPAATVPTLTTTAAKIDIVTCIVITAGSAYECMVAGQNL